jgi:hypothetical protein
VPQPTPSSESVEPVARDGVTHLVTASVDREARGGPWGPTALRPSKRPSQRARGRVMTLVPSRRPVPIEPLPRGAPSARALGARAEAVPPVRINLPGPSARAALAMTEPGPDRRRNPQGS